MKDRLSFLVKHKQAQEEVRLKNRKTIEMLKARMEEFVKNKIKVNSKVNIKDNTDVTQES